MQLIDIDLKRLFGYKNIFNPSITACADGGFLLTCRLQNHPAEGFLGLCLLDRHFKPFRRLGVISTSPLMKQQAKVMMEDSRTFFYNGKTYLYHVESSSSFLYFCYTVFGLIEADGTLSDQRVINYKKNLNAFKAIKVKGLSGNETVLPQAEWIVEKNWQFFISENKYYCVYQAGSKHEIFHFNFPGGAVHEKYITYNNISWKYGRISGGAAPVLHTDGLYYSFFHSWTEWKNPGERRPWLQRQYHVGVYAFESTPPFRIKMISETPFFSGKDNDVLAESGHSVIFPGSAFLDEGTNEWCIALGWNDHSCKMLRIKHEEITAGLKTVSEMPFLSIVKREMMPALQKIRRAGGRIYRLVK